MIYGYARASTTAQDLAEQQQALRAAGCAQILSEKVGIGRQERTELDTLLTFLRAGDTLVVTRIDRLARSLGGLQKIVQDLAERGATLQAIEQSIDTGSPAGKVFVGMLGVFVEFEAAIRKERQADGIAKAKAQGVYKGRKPTVDRAEVRRLARDGLGATEIAKRLGIGRASVYRVLGH